MEQFRQIGEVLGSLKALMVFRDEIRINHRQCCLLVDAFNLAFEGLAEEMRSHLSFNEKNVEWKPLEQPLRELHRIFRDGEHYVRRCMESGNWWGRALALRHTVDCVELLLHNLLWCIPVVLEAIENVGEVSGRDREDIDRKRLLISKKYEEDWMEPKLFQHKLGKLYLVSQDLCRRMDSAWKEDQWILSETIAEIKSSRSKPLTKQENRLAELLIGTREEKLYPSSFLVGTQDYQVRRRLGSGSSIKEVQWMGENFAVKHKIGKIEPLMSEIPLLSSLTHPNIMHYMYSFVDEEKKECFVVMDLLNKDLSSYIKEVCSARRKVTLPLLVAVDTMLQIARGMEYLHSKKIYHGELNPSNVLVKARGPSIDSYLHVKVTGFGLSPLKDSQASEVQLDSSSSFIWYAPEVLQEQEQTENESSSLKFTEKGDVYSFAMICFELLTGKVPFEDNHLQGDKMSKNIRAGERPLFPSQCPKYLTSLTKRCWHSDPAYRPSFFSLTRVLRYVKRFLIMNKDETQSDPSTPPVDYFDLETTFLKRLGSWVIKESPSVSEVPFQMYAYRVLERQKTNANVKDKNSESGSECSTCSDESGFNNIMSDDAQSISECSIKLLQQSSTSSTLMRTSPKMINAKTKQSVEKHKEKSAGSAKIIPPFQQSSRNKFENYLQPKVSSTARRASLGHADTGGYFGCRN